MKKHITGKIWMCVMFSLLSLSSCIEISPAQASVEETQTVVDAVQTTVEESQTVEGIAQTIVEESQTVEGIVQTIVEESQTSEGVEQIAHEDATSEMEVHFVDVGQGDCTLIVCDGEAMLIDAGGNDKGTTVQLYLKKLGIDHLKYLIGTHPDADHIGGMDVILYKYDCETILMSDRENDTAAYRDVCDTIANKNAKVTLPEAGAKYTLGDAEFVLLGPINEYEDDNNSSIVVKVTHGENAFLFMGDAEEVAEQDYIDAGVDLRAQVLKVGHHGSRSSTANAFLEKVNPLYAIISCEKENAYGHPHEETVDKLSQRGCEIYRTDEQGSIVAVSDGKTLSFIISQKEVPLTGENAEEVTYVLNLNTRKFHAPDCPSVGEIKDKNKEESFDTREMIIDRGFAPCKRCNP